MYYKRPLLAATHWAGIIPIFVARFAHWWNKSINDRRIRECESPKVRHTTSHYVTRPLELGGEPNTVPFWRDF